MSSDLTPDEIIEIDIQIAKNRETVCFFVRNLASNAKVILRKKDLIIYKSSKEILFLMYLTDPRISSNREVLKLVKELRGGNWGLIGTGAFLGLIILIFSMGEGFVPNDLNPG